MVDTQPMWFYKDGDALIEALGPKDMNTFIGVKTWKDNGVTVALNADHMQGFDPVGALTRTIRCWPCRRPSPARRRAARSSGPPSESRAWMCSG